GSVRFLLQYALACAKSTKNDRTVRSGKSSTAGSTMVDDVKGPAPGSASASPTRDAHPPANLTPPAAKSAGALAPAPAMGAIVKPTPVKKAGLRRFTVPVLILAALGYGGKTAYDYFVEGRFLVSTDDVYVGADPAIIAAKAMGHLTAVPVVD